MRKEREEGTEVMMVLQMVWQSAKLYLEMWLDPSQRAQTCAWKAAEYLPMAHGPLLVDSACLVIISHGTRH
jgi:hypothetical protein